MRERELKHRTEEEDCVTCERQFGKDNEIGKLK